MSDTPWSAPADDGSSVGGSTWTPPDPSSSRQRRSSPRGRTVLAVAIAGTAVVLGVGGVLAARFLQGSSDELSAHVPASAVLYGHVNLNPSAGNKLGIKGLVDRVNAAAGEPLVSLDTAAAQADVSGVNFAEDVDPWLGDQAAMYATSVAQPEAAAPGLGGESFAALAAVDDADAAADFIESQGPAGPYDAGEGRQGWTISMGSEGEEGVVAVLEDDRLLVGNEDAVRAGLDVEQPLADDQRYTATVEELPNRIVTLWVDVPYLTSLGLAEGGASNSEAVVGPTAVGLGLSDDAIDLTGVALPVDGEQARAEPVAEADLAALPANGLLYGKVPDSGARLLQAAGVVDGSGGAAQEVDRVLSENAGTSLEEISSWLGDLVFMVAYTPQEATGNALVDVVAAVSDEEAATQLLDAGGAQVPADQSIEVASGRIAAGDATVEVRDSAMRLRAGTAAEGTLAENDAYRAAVDGLSGEPVVYLDMRGAVEGAVSLFGPLEDGTEGATVARVASAFDSFVATVEDDSEVVRTNVRVSYASELQPLALPGGGGAPPDIDLGQLGQLDSLVEGSDDQLAQPGAPSESPGPSESPFTDPSESATSASDQPSAFGDDPALDELYTACEGGDEGACDDLYLESPFGSDYEAFGSSCGGRAEGTTEFCDEENR